MSASVTIKELVEVVKDILPDTSKRQIEDAIMEVFATIQTTLQAGEEVVVKNFGRFYTKVKPARTARNPKTGEPVQVAEKTVIKFAPRGDMKGL